MRATSVVLAVGLWSGVGLGAQEAPTPTPRPAGQAPNTPSPAPPEVRESVVVVGVTPIQGLGVDANLVPSNVQTITLDAGLLTGGRTLTDLLGERVASVHVNEVITNPFQPDLQFRGFVASPMLGLPQGLAVYQNGVRLNEPFGDTVNWDLVPSNAIASLSLMPGSNPLFGLNALGGAIAVQTKTGFTHSNRSIAVSGGSFGRGAVEAEFGAHNDSFGYFVAGNVLAEEGWRDHSPSRLRQLFADLEWRRARTTVNTSLSLAANRLIGNAPAPVGLVDLDRSAVFTHPDETKARAALASVRARHSLGPDLLLDANVFFRRAAIRGFNGDDSAYDECAATGFEAFLCSDEGEGDVVIDQFGRRVRQAADAEYDATNNTSRTRTNGWGGTLQLSSTRALGGRANHFVAGVTLDGGQSHYEAAAELARLTDDRGTIGAGLFDRDAAVGVKTRVTHAGLYAANFYSLSPRITFMGSARFHRSAVTLEDQLDDDLDGDHSFMRASPSAGVTIKVSDRATAFASYSRSSRVPAPSELSCADPDDPCRLPNAFVADPPLEEVVADTVEGGLRGSAPLLTWGAAVFQTTNQNDIMFISSGPLTNTGHFQNVGDTVRRGLELSLSGRRPDVSWNVAYSFLSARFATPLTLSSPNHPDADEGEIEVEEGSRIPSVPAHNLSLNLTGTIAKLTLGAGVHATSSQYFRGDEANLLDPIGGFADVHLNARLALGPRVALTARLTNVLGAKYATFGVLGEADEVLGDDFDDPEFVSPGAPRALWVGLELSFR
jgi:iron complex outermembrane receptor protein